MNHNDLDVIPFDESFFGGKGNQWGNDPRQPYSRGEGNPDGKAYINNKDFRNDRGKYTNRYGTEVSNIGREDDYRGRFMDKLREQIDTEDYLNRGGLWGLTR